jgi:hypothetical protein
MLLMPVFNVPATLMTLPVLILMFASKITTLLCCIIMLLLGLGALFAATHVVPPVLYSHRAGLVKFELVLARVRKSAVAISMA